MIDANLTSKQGASVYKILTEIVNADAANIDDVLKLINKAKHGVNIRIKAIGDGRSRQQENYYRKWCREFGSFIGLYEDEMHEVLLCAAFGVDNISTKIGPIERARKRSNDVTKGDYGMLIDALQAKAEAVGFTIPPPMSPLKDT